MFSKLRWSYRVVKIPKDAFFNVDWGKNRKFYFSAFLTTFWSQKPKLRFLKTWKWQNLLCTFLSQNWVKSGQNRPKFKNSKNWEKKQFFHVSITFVAQKVVSPAHIERRWIFGKYKNDNFLVISLKKDPNWSPRSHGARTPPRCQNTPFGMYTWRKI